MAKESIFARDFSIKTSKGNNFRVAVWSWSWCPPFVYALSSYPVSRGWVFCTRLLFLVELMVEQVSRRIQFGLIILAFGASFLVWVMVRPTCSDCVPVRVLAVHGGQFPV